MIVLSDEVYYHMCFDDREHVIFATLGDNFNKTVTVFSGGKLMCATGWKVGWAIGPSRFLHEISIIAAEVNYTFNHPG